MKLILIDSEFSLPTSVLVDEVQNLIDPLAETGSGLGLAPIGHRVTVVPVVGRSVNLSFTLVFGAGVTWVDVESRVLDAIQEYFGELAAGWSGGESAIIRISQLETRILDLLGIVDIGNMKINNMAKNLTLEAGEIPILGSVN